jgi:hypothetical protein
MTVRFSGSYWKVAATLAPPTGMVTVQVFPEEDVQPVQLTKLCPVAGVAVSPTDAPTGNAEIHCVGQLMPPVRLVTVPSPTGVTMTLSVASLPPPGQMGLLGSSTVTVAKPITIFDAPPVPSGRLAEIVPPPQKPGAGDTKPASIVTTPSSIFQFA